MITKNFVLLLSISCFVGFVSSCSMFESSKPNPSTAPHAAQEFDPVSGMWVSAKKVDLPPPAPQNAVLAANETKEKGEGGFMKKVGGVVKKPLTWLPWNKSEAEEAANAPKANPAPASMQQKAN